MAHIAALAPHICVLEEVGTPSEVYEPALAALGYSLVAAKKLTGQGDYTCVFYHHDRVEKASDHVVFRFAEGSTVDPPPSQFVIMCHFIDKVTNSEFVVVAQHAKAGRTAANEAIRLEHAQRLLGEALPAYLARTLRRPGADEAAAQRVLWVGDFNAGPHTYGGKWPAVVVPWVLGEAVTGSSDSDAAAAPPLPLPPMVFESAMKQYFGEHPLFTTCKMRGGQLLCQCIDYVLFPRGAARVVGSLPCPSSDPERELGPLYLPSLDWGSDHLSVYAELVWTAPHLMSSL